MKLSKNFSDYEFECPCCGLYIPNISLVNKLQELRNIVMKPIIVNSGTRCPKHNMDVGGVQSSQHLKGKAADITVRNYPIDQLYKYALEIFKDGGIGRYRTFIHVDVRDYKARWSYRK